ncbi:MAG: Fic family protein [Legionella sp.]
MIALRSAHYYLEERPLGLSFVREPHKILLNSVRGCPLQLQIYLQAWQQYVEFNDIDLLLKAAVVHARFELLDPFKDGNGRIGRILIPLFLYQKKEIIPTHVLFKCLLRKMAKAERKSPRRIAYKNLSIICPTFFSKSNPNTC